MAAGINAVGVVGQGPVEPVEIVPAAAAEEVAVRAAAAAAPALEAAAAAPAAAAALQVVELADSAEAADPAVAEAARRIVAMPGVPREEIEQVLEAALESLRRRGPAARAPEAAAAAPPAVAPARVVALARRGAPAPAAAESGWFKRMAIGAAAVAAAGFMFGRGARVVRAALGVAAGGAIALVAPRVARRAKEAAWSAVSWGAGKMLQGGLWALTKAEPIALKGAKTLIEGPRELLAGNIMQGSLKTAAGLIGLDIICRVAGVFGFFRHRIVHYPLSISLAYATAQCAGDFMGAVGAGQPGKAALHAFRAAVGTIGTFRTFFADAETIIRTLYGTPTACAGAYLIQAGRREMYLGGDEHRQNGVKKVMLGTLAMIGSAVYALQPTPPAAGATDAQMAQRLFGAGIYA